jgi:GAF domain-containing protein
MAESVSYTRGASRKTIYAEILPQIEALLDGETDEIANLANITAVLKEAFGFFWVGFYIQKDGELVLGPFQGPLACTRIPLDKGVCGHAYSNEQTTIVPDVNEFPGHIACSSAAMSEIVVPIFKPNGEVFGVLDVDSDVIDDFSEDDREGLEAICYALSKNIGHL